MAKINHFFCICLITFFCTSLYAQKRDSTWTGTASGVVRDSIHNYVLGAATVALYTVKDSNLVSYQLSNSLGEFHFNNLPLGAPLKAIVSYMGYQSLTRNFVISPTVKTISLKGFNLEMARNKLQEVVINAIPPVRMNGDTLEFNADAFNLDPNAQTEDLLRILPGVTVWGDGTITVNGKKVSRVLVNGKPFFGNDARIATQNLPKNIVDKIQVYQQRKNPDAPQDSVTEVNIRLKKGRGTGYFGKVGIGYGTRDRYAADGSFNLYYPQTQVAIVASGNNVNKIANNTETLMLASTYKGSGANLLYQPDFTINGLNKFNSGGLTYQHDFIPDPGFYKNNRLTADYFIKDNHENLLLETQTIISLSGDSSIKQQNKNKRTTSDVTQSANSKYEKKKKNNVFSLSSSYNTANTNSTDESQASSFFSNKGLQSTNNTRLEKQNNSKDLIFEGTYKHIVPYSFPSYEIAYTFNAKGNNSDEVNQTNFSSTTEPNQNRSFHRIYNNRSDGIAHQLFFRLLDFNSLLFGRNKLSGIIVGLQNKSSYNSQKDNNIVEDKDMLTGITSLNSYLTNKSRYNSINLMPALTLEKTIRKGLKDRFIKNLSFRVDFQAQFFRQENESNHAFQHFSNSYQEFVPAAGINFTNQQLGEYKNDYALSFTTSANYPSARQLVALADSANPYFIYAGNIALREQIKRELAFKFEHVSERVNTPFLYSLLVKAGTVQNYFADSTFTDALGRSMHYTANADGHRYLNAGGNLSRAFKFKDHQLQLTFISSSVLSRNPNFVNNVLNYSANFTTYARLGFQFTFKDWVAANLAQSFNYYQSKGNGSGNVEFSNSNHATELCVSVSLANNLLLGSNIAYNRNTSSGSNSNSYTIWNANASYRLFKEKNAELTFVVLDILHQNTGIINDGFNNSITNGTINVLQQYFMTTFTYYPRKFGKKPRHM